MPGAFTRLSNISNARQSTEYITWSVRPVVFGSLAVFARSSLVLRIIRRAESRVYVYLTATTTRSTNDDRGTRQLTRTIRYKSTNTICLHCLHDRQTRGRLFLIIREIVTMKPSRSYIDGRSISGFLFLRKIYNNLPASTVFVKTILRRYRAP